MRSLYFGLGGLFYKRQEPVLLRAKSSLKSKRIYFKKEKAVIMAAHKMIFKIVSRETILQICFLIPSE